MASSPRLIASSMTRAQAMVSCVTIEPGSRSHHRREASDTLNLLTSRQAAKCVVGPLLTAGASLGVGAGVIRSATVAHKVPAKVQ